MSPTARIPDNRYAPAPVAVYDYRRRGNERLYEADVTAVRAVLGTPEQRCWVEREQIAQERSQANVPAAIAGAVIGGILGHQVGSGRGNDLATVGGAVAGAAVGANVGRSGGQSGYTQDVKRCENVPGSARPDYWDVTYNFRGREGHVQMITPPGRTITVNEQGEPRALVAGGFERSQGGPPGPPSFWRLPNPRAYCRVNSAPRKKICAE